jgi:hypothetical protein
MSGADSLLMLMALVMAGFFLILNVFAGSTWLKVLSLWCMLGSAFLAGWVLIQTLLLR